MAKPSQDSSRNDASRTVETIKLIVEEYFGPVVQEPIKRFEADLESLLDRVAALEIATKADPREQILQDLEILEGRIKRLKQIL